MISAEVLNATGEIIYTVKFYGLDLSVGLILGGIAIFAFLNQIRGMSK